MRWQFVISKEKILTMISVKIQLAFQYQLELSRKLIQLSATENVKHPT